MALQIPDTNGTMVPAVGWHPDRTQVITDPVASGVVTLISSETQLVRIYATAMVHIEIDNSATATTSHAPLGAGVEHYIATKGKTQVAAILNTGSTGKVYVTECY